MCYNEKKEVKLKMKITQETRVEEVAEKTKKVLYEMVEKAKEEDTDDISTTGDFVRAMRTRCSRVQFSEHDFMRLFIAMLSFHDQLTLDVDNLGYKLYKYHDTAEYQILLQDFEVKQQIEGNFFKVEEAVQSAILGTLLSSHYISPTSSNRLINIQKEEATEVIASYDSEIVDKMDSLTKDFISLYTKPKQKSKQPSD